MEGEDKSIQSETSERPDRCGIETANQETRENTIETSESNGTERTKRKYTRTGKHINRSRNLQQFEINKILLRHQQGLSIDTIGKELNIHRSTAGKVIQKFKNVFKQIENVEDFRTAKKDIIDATLLLGLNSLVDEKKHEQARLGEVAKAVDVLYKASRLEHGLSTNNTQSQSLIEVREVVYSSDS